MPLAVIRFFRYASVGFSTFLLDLLLLYVLIDLFLMNYVFAAGVAFLVAVSINYAISRVYVFKRSTRDVKTGYVNFLSIALVGLAFVMGGMYVLVSLYGFNYVISRVSIAGLTGFWNYLINLYVNFQVSGKH